MKPSFQVPNIKVPQLTEEQRNVKDNTVKNLLLYLTSSLLVAFIGFSLDKPPLDPYLMGGIVLAVSTTIHWIVMLKRKKTYQLWFWTLVWIGGVVTFYQMLIPTTWTFWSGFVLGVATCIVIILLAHADINKTRQSYTPTHH